MSDDYEKRARALWRRLKRHVVARVLYPDPTKEIVALIADELRRHADAIERGEG